LSLLNNLFASREQLTLPKQVNIGILNANPSTSEGTIKILEDLDKVKNSSTITYLLIITISLQYVPQSRKIPVHGDSLTVESVAAAKLLRVSDFGEERLANWEPIPQEFHHRMLIMKVGLS
jgi:hypothetical protein